eukprot:359876-Chlamydomonas_euryale.AAC.2
MEQRCGKGVAATAEESPVHHPPDTAGLLPESELEAPLGQSKTAHMEPEVFVMHGTLGFIHWSPERPPPVPLPCGRAPTHHHHHHHHQGHHSGRVGLGLL